MIIKCAYCGNVVGEYLPKAKGKPIDNKEIGKAKLDINCKNNIFITGAEVILPNVDPTMYSVRLKNEVKCSQRLRSFTLKGGVLWGM